MSIKFFLLFSLAISALFAAAPKEQDQVIPTVIIGGGMGGATAAIYLSRANLHPVVIEGTAPGGALAQSEAVENWPGAMQIQGAALMEGVRSQAVAYGAEFLREEVISVDFSKKILLIKTRSLDDPSRVRTFQAASCIVATGSSPNFLGVLGEKQYWGKGVSNCAICDGSLYKGKRVGIVGGGDSALLEALYLSNIAKEVDLFVRKDELKASDQLRKEKVLALPNVKVHFLTSVEEVLGNEEGVTGVKIRSQGKMSELSLDGLFLAIGAKPNTALFKGKLDLDAQGYIVLKEGQHTSVPNVYAIGDVVDPLYKQAISAAGDGAKAALEIQNELSTKTFVTVAKEPLAERIVQIVEISSVSEFDEELQKNEGPVLVDFYASWCGPCKRLSPRLEAAAEKLDGKVKFLKVNVDEVRDLSGRYRIRAMPTALLFDQSGKIVERAVGSEEIGALLGNLENQTAL